MRDFRDAKAMARSLRDALSAKAVQTTHSESLADRKGVRLRELEYSCGQD